MRKLFITLLISLFIGIVGAQDSPTRNSPVENDHNEESDSQHITGQWHGLLEISGNPLRLVLNIETSEAGYSSTLDSPDQGATGIPVNTTTFAGDTLNIAVMALNLTYVGGLKDNRIKGTFNQSGFTLPLEFSREAIEKPETKRPQEPKELYPYHSEEVVFSNSKARDIIAKNAGTESADTEASATDVSDTETSDTEVSEAQAETSNSQMEKNPSEVQTGITLAGTLTMPEKEGKYPVAILISGSGPQDRDEALAGHKPFLVIADHLTRNGIAVLRFDDRGVGESTGNFEEATWRILARMCKVPLIF